MNRFLLLLTITVPSLINCMVDKTEYRLATAADQEQMLDILMQQECEPTLISLPRKCRPAYIDNLIRRQRLFVATRDGSIVGYKKLFLVDEAEKREKLCSELCCGTAPVYTAHVTVAPDGSTRFIHVKDEPVEPELYSACIYDGGDFTLTDYRGQGINRRLTDAAFDAIKPTAMRMLAEHPAPFLTLAYGLAKTNAGDVPGGKTDRTVPISRAFARFIQMLPITKAPREEVTFYHKRHPAYTPMFRLDAESCEPVPHTPEDVPQALGCILSYSLV